MEKAEVIEGLRRMVDMTINLDASVLQAAADLLENRWSGFDDEDLRELRAGAAKRRREGGKAIPVEYRNRAGLLAEDLRQELRRREAERSDYRGPGIYRHVGGNELEVLGKTQEHVIMRSTNGGTDPGDLMAVPLTTFDDRIGALEPRYTWVREA
jgi:hypothetical protein